MVTTGTDLQLPTYRSSFQVANFVTFEQLFKDINSEKFRKIRIHILSWNPDLFKTNADPKL